MLEFQLRVTAGAAVPVPVSDTVVGEFEALLVMVTLEPVTPPVAAGAKVTLKANVCPGVTICPVEMPDALNPAPLILTAEIVTLADPAFVRFTLSTLLRPTLTLPNARLDVLGFSGPRVAALTVSVAALLVTLPAELLTATVNFAPFAAVVSEGVV